MAAPVGLKVPKINFEGGGGGGVGTISETLSDAELGIISNNTDQILDAFTSEKGTKVNLSVTNSALRFDVGQTTGSYERLKETSTLVSGVEGETIVTAQLLAPKISGVTGNVIVFGGDQTDILATGNKVIIFKEVESDNVTTSIALRGLTSVAILEISTAVYSVGNDETTLTLLNPDLLDLSNGVAGVDQFDQLRVMSLFIDPQAQADGGAYESMELTSLHNMDVLRLQGESLATVIAATVSGSVFQTVVDMSDNKQYGIARVMERLSGDTDVVYHFFYTADRGKTWQKFAFTDTLSSSFNNRNLDMGYYGSTQLIVADNGKCFVAYTRVTVAGSAGPETWAVYGDISAVTPTLNRAQKDANPPGAINYGSVETYKSMVNGNRADLSDLNLMIVGSSDVLVGSIFHNGGATYTNNTNPATNIEDGWSHEVLYHPTANGGSERYYYIGTSTGGTLGCRYSDGDLAALTVINPNATVNSYLMGATISENYLHIMYRNGASGAGGVRYKYMDLATNIWSGVFLLNDLATYTPMDRLTDLFSNAQHVMRRRIKVNPLDEKHVFIMMDVQNITAPCTMLHEIKDITTATLGTIQGYSGTANTLLVNIPASSEKLIQTSDAFAPNSPIKTVMVRGQSISSTMGGSTMWTDPASELVVKLKTGLVPDAGTLLGEVRLSRDEVNAIWGANSAWHPFNFDGLTNGAGEVHVELSVEGGSTTDFFTMYASGANAVAGTAFRYNGTSWVDEAEDLSVLWFQDTWISNPFPEQDRDFNQGRYYRHTNGQIEFADSNQLLVSCTRQYDGTINPLTGGNDFAASYRGQPWGRKITIGTTEQSILSDKQMLTGGNDRHLTVNLSLGDDEYDTNNSIYTGTGGDNLGATEASVGVKFAGASTTAPIAVADTDFQSGNCLDFDRATTNFLIYEHDQIHFHDENTPFTIEVEFKAETIGSGIAGDEREFISKYRAGTPIAGQGQGWAFYINASGFLEFFHRNSTTILYTTASDVTETAGVYTRVRAVFDPRVDLKVRLYRDTGSGWNEVASYSSQADYTAMLDSTGNPISLYIGCRSDADSAGGDQQAHFFDGKIGYVKMIQNESAFAYEGFQDQRPVLNHSNLGHFIIGDRVQHRSTDVNNVYYQPVIAQLDPKIAKVDSRDQRLVWEKTLAEAGQNTNLKLNLTRVGDEDQSSVQGVIFQYKK